MHFASRGAWLSRRTHSGSFPDGAFYIDANQLSQDVFLPRVLFTPILLVLVILPQNLLSELLTDLPLDLALVTLQL
jgi:hypothetical protein